MKIIELRSADGCCIYVNIDRALTLYRTVDYVGTTRQECTFIDFGGEDYIQVKETPEEICKMISQEEGSICAGT